MIEKHYKWAKSIAGRYCTQIGLQETEDIKSIGLIGLVKAGNKYNSNSAPFKYWATIFIRGEIKNYIKGEVNSLKAQAKLESTILSEYFIMDSLEYSIDDLESRLIAKELIGILEKRVSKKTFEVLKLHYVQGYTCAEIAENWGCTRANISDIKRRGEKRLKDICRIRGWGRGKGVKV